MKLYRIRNWNDAYENNRTRELKKLDWFPMPNKQDGDGYTLIMEQKNGAAIYGAWVACVQIASRCDPRGTLLRDGKKPHDSNSLSRMSRMPKELFDTMLKTVSHPDINWLEIIELQDEIQNPADGCEITADGCLEGKGREGKEEKGMERTETAKHVVEYLNQTTGKRFQNSDESLKPIKARLKEGFTKEDCFGVIDVKVKAWLHDPKMNMYLRPSTLFNAEKFSNYLGEVGAIKPEKPFEF